MCLTGLPPEFVVFVVSTLNTTLWAWACAEGRSGTHRWAGNQRSPPPEVTAKETSDARKQCDFSSLSARSLGTAVPALAAARASSCAHRSADVEETVRTTFPTRKAKANYSRPANMAAAESLFSGQIAITGGKCLAITSFIIAPAIGLGLPRSRSPSAYCRDW
jgi:hypothetical protein